MSLSSYRIVQLPQMHKDSLPANYRAEKEGRNESQNTEERKEKKMK